MRILYTARAAVTAAVVIAGSGTVVVASASANTAPTGRPAAAALPADTSQACATSTTPGVANCLALIRTNIGGPAANAPVGYGPSSLQSAYQLPSASGGSGQTVAIVDAFDDPNAQADLNTYRAQFGLPACGAGCFTKVNQSGQSSPLPAPSGASGWSKEESLDLDMVSAICQNCHILLVEANSPQIADLGAAVNAAVASGARYVSNSYGSAEYANETNDDAAYYNHPGVAVTVSAGDSGFGVQFPAASPHVVAVGGTSLFGASNARGWSESTWTGSGSGCSAFEAKPTWQTDTGCSHRTNNDVSAVADPATGVAVYDSYDNLGWSAFGGTSASSPIIASTYALAGTPAAGSYPAATLYAHPSNLFDVTSGTNGTCSLTYLCTAGPGYDAPTGLGTPNGTTAFKSGGSNGYEVAFQANGSNTLYTYGTAGAGNTGLGIAAGTSPSITALTGGGYEAAFQANGSNALYTYGTAGADNTGLGIAAGTSPSITALP